MKLVKPVMIDPVRFGAHYAVSSLFRDYIDEDEVYCYCVSRRSFERLETGKQKLAVGMIHIRSRITLEEDEVSFAVLHMGDHNIFGGVREFMGEEPFSEMWNDISRKFKENDIPGTFRRIEKHFTSVNYSLWHLFRDEQRAVINRVMESAVTELERNLRQLNEVNLPVVHVMRKMGVPLPGVFSSIMEFILNDDMKKMLMSENIDHDGIRRIIHQMKEWGFEPDTAGISYSFTQRINTCMEEFAADPGRSDILERIINLMDTLETLSLRFERWRMQNIFFITGKDFLPEMRRKAEEEINGAAEWIALFERLGAHLKVNVP